MNQRSSATARIFAATALAAAFVLAIVVISAGGIGGGSSGSDRKAHSGETTHRAAQQDRKVPAIYVVQSGDTLVSIAHRAGISVARIQRLNPEVDPQILIAGETLELK